MPTSDAMSAKKRELLAYKAKILQEIKYCDKRIEEVRSKCLKSSFVQDSDSSDSEEEFSLSIDNGPSASQLKLQQTMLRTCLQATQELTTLQVLQSEVNVLVDDPVIEGEPPVKEPGVWREVTAECRVDLVPFSITFYVHDPDHQFGQLSYRGLRVVPVKDAHKGELDRSVLPSVARPGDAVEVLKSFAAAQRSRRTTLARLADKYPSQLYMEPMPDGGYILKCANLLEVSWTLQNKWSPIAPFHHRMKFDLEYMDESYIKIITHAHRQLSDPSLETDERTLLLAKIISTCLEAQGPTQELYESMSSDPETTQTLKTRRTTLDQEPEGPGMKKRTEKELMAPPKSLPKKTKLKGKENIADNRKEKLKRGNSDENMNSVKKMRTEQVEEGIVSENVTESNEKVKSTVGNEGNLKKKKDSESVASNKSNEPKKVQNKKENEAANKEDKENNALNGNSAEKSNKVKENKEATQSKNLQKPANTNKNNDKPKPIKEKTIKAIKNDDNTKTTKEKNISEVDRQKTVVNAKKVPNTAESPNNVDEDKEKSAVDKIKKVKSAAIPKNKDTAKATDSNNKNVKEKASVEKGDNVVNPKKVAKTAESLKNIDEDKEKSTADKIKKVKNAAIPKIKNSAKATDSNNINVKETATVAKGDEVQNVAVVKNKPTTEEVKEKKLESQKKVASAKNKESTKIKLPTIKTKANVDSTKKVIANNEKKVVNKPQTDKIIKNKTTQDKNKPIESTKKTKNTPTDKKENTIEKVVEKRVAVKRKSNIVDRIDNVTSTKKIKTPENTANSTEKVKNTASDNKMQKIKNKTPKIYQKFKSKLLPGGIKTHTGNTKVLGNIEKQNSDKKSKIPQKKLSAISEATLMKNPLRISPRKIPSKFKTSSEANKMIQKTTNIPRLLKKPVPKT